MRFETPLTQGRLIRRYKRFLAEVTLQDGTEVTVHVPNTGSMMSTSSSGSPVALSYSSNPKRKLPWTLELYGAARGFWVGVNTYRTNRIVEEAIRNGGIKELVAFNAVKREVRHGANSRIDLLLEKSRSRCYVEVKNVTYKNGVRALFPDAVTARGLKHLRELVRIVEEGHRGVIFFCVNRADCEAMSPAREIDPRYADALEEAVDKGVECLAYATRPTVEEVAIERQIPVIL